ncbi:hypothetical protein CTZ28_20905 [Streptomyces shenzhenensis]|uniref:Uncharacterized protein n=1 Tax=Streptomyces shenzhenensis TaxID=943815 RepID=A0A3M0I542_9ACTN|nr:hypothetical protein CTZ28_20905 [Streptomyces shenzhenensis]
MTTGLAVYGPCLAGVPMDLERALASRQLTLALGRAGQAEAHRARGTSATAASGGRVRFTADG